MNRRQMMMLSSGALALRPAAAQSQNAPAKAGGKTPDQLLLKDYRPVSIYKIPKTEITRAKYPVFDAHFHGVRPVEELDKSVKIMDAAGMEKTVIYTAANSAERFAEVSKPYLKYPDRFEMWCSFDLSGVDQPGFGPKALKALEDCHRAGAEGVGEITDKGWGIPVAARNVGAAAKAGPSAAAGIPRGSEIPTVRGPHPDDPSMDALWEKCAQLGMPINIHISDPISAYQPQDEHNDGLMNGWTWRIDDKVPGILGHEGLIQSLDRALAKHPKTVFIACHLMNLDYDLTRLGGMLDRHPNLYTDISARFCETAATPRAAARFIQKYQDRVLYATDMPHNPGILSTTFRILETDDEHFYEQDLYFNFDYHWPMHGFALPAVVLKKMYKDNAMRAFKQAGRA
jgi:predicted TIM-barrel fold metal-dependent hydrolase